MRRAPQWSAVMGGWVAALGLERRWTLPTQLSHACQGRMQAGREGRALGCPEDVGWRQGHARSVAAAFHECCARPVPMPAPASRAIDTSVSNVSLRSMPAGMAMWVWWGMYEMGRKG